MKQETSTVLLGLNLQELTRIVEDSGQPSYRAQQLFHAIYADRVSSTEQVSTLPKEFRSTLASEGIEVGIPAIQKKFISEDGTMRYLIELSDGETVETVWMPEGDDGEAGDGTEAGAEVVAGGPRSWNRATRSSSCGTLSRGSTNSTLYISTRRPRSTSSRCPR